MLVKGASMRAISGSVDVSISNLKKMLIDAGNACAENHDQSVQAEYSRHLECKEIWSYVIPKARTLPK